MAIYRDGELTEALLAVNLSKVDFPSTCLSIGPFFLKMNLSDAFVTPRPRQSYARRGGLRM